ncbi:hypothetical protein SLS63_004223 [Diaporthe eres]|uniref:Peptidase S8/S53 domain-containing protein n=1 Tax=Diaporthe eres TaxID=83184 RepID=A0ABR1PEN6_DIAER
MTPSNGDLKPDPQGPRVRRSPSPRAPEGDDASTAEKPSPAIAYRVKTPGQVLHDAIARKDLEGLTRIIRASPDCVNAKNDRGRTPLHVAAQNGQNDIVKLLISEGAEVNARTKWKYTPLTLAAESPHPDVVVTLLDSGADLGAVTKEGFTPLHRAVQKERKSTQDTLAILLIRGANCNALDKEGLTALQGAVSAGNLSNARVLCAFGADPHFKNTDGKNAFDRARKLKDDARDDMNETLFKWGHCGKQIREILPQLSQFIKEEGQIDASAMVSWASREGHRLLVEFILKFMAKDIHEIVQSEGLKKGWKPIHHAAWAGQSIVAEILLAHGSDVNARTGTQKWTPLHLAAGKGRQNTLRVLLDNGADILALTEQVPRWVAHEGSQSSEPATGVTAFWLTAVGRHPKSLDVLLQYVNGMKDGKSRSMALEYYEKAREHPASLSGHQDDDKSGHDDDHNTRHDSEVDTATSVPGAKGSFDGTFFSEPASPVWDNFDFKNKYDRPVKVAVLDTGLDVTHKNFENHRFVGGKQVWSSEKQPSQYDRIKACEDFTSTGPITEKDDMKDLDGHGTQVTELILRIAPRAELYIARICEGDINRGTPTTSSPTGNPVTRPRPDIVAKAIDWAREQKVDIINMSFGFYESHRDVKAALNRAVRDSKILVFAAMSNDGNNSQHAAWPARDPNLAIGVHSCDKYGRKTSGFTPRYVHGSHNFMFVGEEVITQWPEAKGGGFRLDQGTSFAAPAVAAMAALILAFAWQHMCRKEREDAEVDLEELRELGGMEKVLERISEKDETLRYSYIHPRLLWKDLSPRLAEDKSQVRQHAWKVIVESLRL